MGATVFHKMYDALIMKMVERFEEIDAVIEELSEDSGELAAAWAEESFTYMERLRSIPQLQFETNRIFHQIIGHMRDFLRRLHRKVIEALSQFDEAASLSNYASIARLIARLHSMQWIDRSVPGMSKTLMNDIEEDLKQRSDG
jgi:predicted house-cleaning noncanonical NTP pyrophosphatase (MazG superfamily)